MEKIRVKECAMCGKVFVASGRGNRCYCGARCRHEKILQASREYYRTSIREEARKVYTGASLGLAELNQKARAAGMTYGKYMLSLRMEQQRKESDRGCAGEIKDAPRA